MKRGLLLVDLSGLFHAAWHATAHKELNEAFDITYSAVRGVAAEYDAIAICCDSGGKTWRHEMCSTYKATRPEHDEQMIGQLRDLELRLADDGMHVFARTGFEADDIIATLAEWATARQMPAVIMSDDKDMAACVGEFVQLYRPRQRATLDVAGVAERWLVPPSQMGDMLALMGDTSDNIEGIKGVGHKTAARLLREHGTLAGIVAAAVAGQLTPKLSESIIDADKRGVLVMARALVALRTDALTPEECATVLEPPRAVEKGAEMQDVPDAEFSDAYEPPAEIVEVHPGAGGDGRDIEMRYRHLEPQAGKAPEPAATPPEQPTRALAIRDGRWTRQLEPTSAHDAFVLAREIEKSRLFVGYGNAQAVLVAIMKGRALGMSAIDAVSGIHVIKGKASLAAQTVAGLVLASGKADYFEPVLAECDDKRATWVTRRAGRAEQQFTFTIEMAKRAGLTGNDNWQKRPDTMLLWRSCMSLARLIYPDVVANTYSTEELTDQERAEAA